jgi:hypothetical protein
MVSTPASSTTKTDRHDIAEILLKVALITIGVVIHGLMISFITLTCIDGQQLNKQYDHNDFQVDVPDSIGVSKIKRSMYV